MLSWKFDSPNINCNGRFVKGGIDVVDRNGVEGICGVAADIDDNAKAPVLTSSHRGLPGNKVGDLGREIDAVDEDVDV